MDQKLLHLIASQYDKEATDEYLYRELARHVKQEHNKKILEDIANDEKKHKEIWGRYISRPPKIKQFKVRLLGILSKIFGLVFVINLMEKGEFDAIHQYREMGKTLPVALEILEDEDRHEDKLIAMIREEKLSYISSMVLGLNDALVELTGALAGFTLALNDNTMIGLAGFITGVAATLSMAASEYLARKADPGEKHPLKAAGYTGMAYLFTVAFLLLPYALCPTPLTALALCLFNATLIILGFTYFVSIVRKTSFLRGFREMITISATVALIAFLIGWAARTWLNLDV